MDENTASLIKLLEASHQREKELSDQMLQMQEKMVQMQQEMQGKINSLIQQLAWFQKKMFGKMSERYKNLNLGPSLFDGIWPEADIVLEEMPVIAEDIAPIAVGAKKKRVLRKDIMEGLPVFQKKIEPEGVDITRYKRIGEECTKVLEF